MCADYLTLGTLVLKGSIILEPCASNKDLYRKKTCLWKGNMQDKQPSSLSQSATRGHSKNILTKYFIGNKEMDIAAHLECSCNKWSMASLPYSCKACDYIILDTTLEPHPGLCHLRGFKVIRWLMFLMSFLHRKFHAQCGMEAMFFSNLASVWWLRKAGMAWNDAWLSICMLQACMSRL